MMRRSYGLALAVCLGASTVGGQPDFQGRPGHRPGLMIRVNSYTKPHQFQELRSQLFQIASAARGKVGVAAVVLETGDAGSRSWRDI